MADILTRVAEYVNKIPTGEARPSVRRKLYEDLAELEAKAARYDWLLEHPGLACALFKRVWGGAASPEEVADYIDVKHKDRF